MEHSKKTTREEYQKCVNAVVDYINLHLGEEIDLKSLAKISHFSPFYFHRIMKAFLGEPIGTFIVRTRTEAAARLLRYSDLPIADIAYRIGYSSPSSLYAEAGYRNQRTADRHHEFWQPQADSEESR